MPQLEYTFAKAMQGATTLEACVKKLTVHFAGATQADIALLLGALKALAQTMDGWGSKLAAESLEPDYHNRMHAFQVMTALFLLFAQEDLGANSWPHKQWPTFLAKERLLILIAALGHDALHPGGVNSKPLAFEKIAAKAVTQILQQHQVAKEEVVFVRDLILSTDFELVGTLHDRLSQFNENQTIPLELRAAALLTEADILPSVLPIHGEHLATLLSSEWKKAGVLTREDPALPETRKRFLGRVRFSSPHAQTLGVPGMIEKQLRQLSVFG